MPGCLCSDDSIFEYNSTPYANDHMYLFDGGEFTKNGLYIRQPVDMFSALLYNYIKGPNSFPRVPSAHSLWMDWIQYAGFRVSPKLPHLFTANGPSEGKINKEWNI